MNRGPLIGVTLLALATLVFWFVPRSARSIERDITARVTQQLTDANISSDPGSLRVVGRDVTLTGARGSSIVSDRTRDLIAGVTGVRNPVHVVIVSPPAPVVPPKPAPPPLSPEAQKLETDLTKLLAGKTIRFGTANDVIRPEGKAVLDQVYKILAAAPQAAVDITGYTDSDGDADANIVLSKRRAAAVKRYLVRRGIKATRMETDGFGSTKPIAPEDTPENKARNRRIEFHASARILAK
ncbi:MAG TPA: OmpA family protein [Bryobacteraceae bacterium]